MTYLPQADFEDRLRRRLAGASRIAVVGIGDELNAHDRLGMLAAKEIEALHMENLRVFLAGTVPESVTGPVRKYRPDAILLLDAADMDARPGTVAIVAPTTIRASLQSTHALPLSVVMEFHAKDTGARVTLIGLQPDLTWESLAPARTEQAGLTRLLARLFHILGEPRSGRRPRPSRRRRGSRAS